MGGRSVGQQHRISALRLLAVGVEMDYDRSLLLSDLETNEGAGMLAFLAINLKSADHEKLFIPLIDPQHFVPHEFLKLTPRRILAITTECDPVIDAEDVTVLHDEVVEEGEGIATLHLDLSQIGLGLLLPAECQLVHLVPGDKDRMPKDVVDRVHEAVHDSERHWAPWLEPEVVVEENLRLVIDLAIGGLVEVASKVALALIKAIDALHLRPKVDTTTHARTGATPGAFALAGFLARAGRPVLIARHLHHLLRRRLLQLLRRYDPAGVVAPSCHDRSWCYSNYY